MMLSPACGCATEGGEELADETSETSGAEGFRSDVSVCVDIETNECRIDWSGQGCVAAEDDACSGETYSPRACYAAPPWPSCVGVFVGDDCPTNGPYEDACNFF